MCKMAKIRSPNRDKAYEIWINSNRKILLKEIAEQLNVSDSQVRKWKNADKWEERANGNVTIKKRGVNGNIGNITIAKKKKRGAQPKNKNAVGNDGGAPPENQNATKSGFYSKYIPAEDIEILECTPGAGQLEKELILARYKMARLIKDQQEKQKTGISSKGKKYGLQDDYYDIMIQKQIDLISRLEIRIHKIKSESEDKSKAEEAQGNVNALFASINEARKEMGLL